MGAPPGFHPPGRYRGPVKPIAVVRNQASCPLGVIASVFDARGAAWRYVDAWRGSSLPDIAEVSGVVVLGGAMNADEVDAFPWLADVRGLLGSAVAAEVPVLGVCLGAQLLARACDAEVTRAPMREIGFRKVAVVTNDPVLGAFAPSALVFQWHEDTCALPAGADLLATNDDTRVQAYRVGSRAYGVQFHFEVTTEQITAWSDETGASALHDVWGTTKEALLASAESHLAGQQEAGRRLASAWVDQVVAGA
jgi:GMP synthase (glutamine-hydrolysing)